MINPYVVGNWVWGRDFYGRETLIDEILRGPNNCLWVIGNRRVGKTSLLRQLDHLCCDSSAYLSLFWDLQGCESSNALAETLLEALEDAGKQTEGLEGEDVHRIVRALNRQARQQGRRLLLLCDEGEALVNVEQAQPGALQHLRRTLQGDPNIRTVLVSSKRLALLNDLCRRWLTSPFLHGFAVRYLAGLTDEEAESLIRQDHLDTPVETKPATAADIRARTNNHPYLIQLLCHRLFQRDSHLRPITAGDLIVDEHLAACLGNDFEHLSAGEQRILHQLCLAGQATAQELQEATGIGATPTFVDGLTRLGHLRREGDAYTIGNEFFARWLRDYAPWEEKSEVSDEGTLRAYLRVFVSHSTKDRPFVEHLAHDLRRAGVKVWYSEWEIGVGDSIVQKINEGLEESDYLLVALSPDAVESRWVQAELSAALMDELSRRHIRVLPVLYRDCQIPPLLHDLRYADFRSSYDEGLQQVLRSLGL